MLNLKSKLNELNPQFLREIKGSLKTRNLILTITASFIIQLIFFIPFQSELTPPDIDSYQRVFDLVSFMVIFVVLVIGTYTLINDLATEKRRGTINFIRLSPQSSQSILFGKMLGVPILLYIVILPAIPFHLWLGLNAQLPLHQILLFYVILVAATIFYFSAALLFSLVGSWLGRSQVALGSGCMVVFLVLNNKVVHGNKTDFPGLFRLINPQYFLPDSPRSFSLSNLHWFGLPLGQSFVISAGFSLLIYFMGTYFIWQSIERCYYAPNTTMLSKKQSYILTTSFTAITLGCANSLNNDVLFSLIFLNFGLFLYLIAALTPNRQTLQDWARYQHIYRVNHPGKHKLLQDLIWGEKSPGILAIAINALIVITSFSGSIFIESSQSLGKFNALASLIFTFSLLLIYAALAQLLLFKKNEQQLLWTNTIMAGVIVLPTMLLSIGFHHPINQTFMWLFSIYAPMVFLYPPTHTSLGAMVPLLAILGHLSILGLLLFQVKRQLQKAGESATKALLTPN